MYDEQKINEATLNQNNKSNILFMGIKKNYM